MSPASALTSASTSTVEDVGGDKYTPPDLRGKVAIITGASRGIGKGIALELGKAGMTVYVASRSSRSSSQTTSGVRSNDVERKWGDDHLTVERTAEEINNSMQQYAGRAIPIPMDVTNDLEIAALIAQVKAECGRLDAVICSAFTIPPTNNNGKDENDASSSIRDEFWKQGAAMWDSCFNVSLRGAYITCCESVPLMMDTAKRSSSSNQQPQGTTTSTTTTRPLIAIISSFGAKSYTFNVAYGVAKAGSDRLVADMAVELSKHNIDTVSIYPGIVRTENNLEMDRRGEWNAASGGLDLQNGESPQFTGRALAMFLSNSELRKERSGKVVVVAELAKELGFTDIDGRTPPSIRNLKFLLPNIIFPMIEKQNLGGASLPSWIKDNVPEYLLPWFIFSGGPPPTIE